MTNENLKIKAQFLGAHIGCMMSYNLQYPERYSSLLGLDIKAERCLVNDADWKDVWCPMRHCKLILRPISDITETEAIELSVKIGAILENDILKVSRSICDSGIHVKIFVKYRHERPYNAVTFIFGDLEMGTMFFDGVKQSHKCSEIIDWLRSQNFALPFCGKDPIAENWAILQSKSHPQP